MREKDMKGAGSREDKPMLGVYGWGRVEKENVYLG